MFENPRSGRQARNFTTNAPKILDLKSSSEQIFSRKLPLGAPVKIGEQRRFLVTDSIHFLKMCLAAFLKSSSLNGYKLPIVGLLKVSVFKHH